MIDLVGLEVNIGTTDSKFVVGKLLDANSEYLEVLRDDDLSFRIMKSQIIYISAIKPDSWDANGSPL